MIVDERMVSFINSLDAGNPTYLNELEEYARATDVPIVRTEMQSFLRFLMKMKQPMQILEVGTAIGFSALLMSEYAPVGCEITTIEKYEPRIPIARENFRKAGCFPENNPQSGTGNGYDRHRRAVQTVRALPG